jgi:chemotaxis family two-component system sensor kinase Cph1
MSRQNQSLLENRLKRVLWVAGIVWSLIVLGLFLKDRAETKHAVLQMALRDAMSNFNRDQVLLLWTASQGGVYVPVTEKTPPDPLLKDVPERDIVTPTGKHLTLMNPPRILRQMMAQYSDLYGVRGHLTSLKFMTSETAPDDWEKSALLAFERGEKEVTQISEIGGTSYFRFMRPLFVEASCLKCHCSQGYKAGDIRGGVSVSVPFTPYGEYEKQAIFVAGLSLGILWVLGFVGMGVAGRSLERRIEERQKTEEKYASVVENSLTGIYIVQDGKVAFCNSRFAEIYGYSKEEIAAMDSLELAHPEDRALIEEVREKRLQGENVPPEYEIRGIRKSGEVIWVQRRNTLIEYDGSPAILGNVLDVTGLKKAEAALIEHSKEVEQKNRELEEFASIASHDLREPLRKVKAFGDLLASKCASLFDDESRDYMKRIQNATARMQVLIDSLLTYARVTTKAQSFAPVDLNQAVKEALSNLELQVKETNGVVEVSSLPSVVADEQQMIQLFQNLIGNALKFHRKGDPPRVKIHSRMIKDDRIRPSGAYEISVEDRGIGFDEKDLRRIFAPFERLHSRGEYEGVGMGLAISRKIVERHGGSITAKSTLGQGSTFIIILPADLE